MMVPLFHRPLDTINQLKKRGKRKEIKNVHRLYVFIAQTTINTLLFPLKIEWFGL